VDAVHAEAVVPGELAEPDAPGLDLDPVADEPHRVEHRLAVRVRPPAFDVGDSNLGADREALSADLDLEVGHVGPEAAERHVHGEHAVVEVQPRPEAKLVYCEGAPPLDPDRTPRADRGQAGREDRPSDQRRAEPAQLVVGYRAPPARPRLSRRLERPAPDRELAAAAERHLVTQ